MLSAEMIVIFPSRTACPEPSTTCPPVSEVTRLAFRMI